MTARAWFYSQPGIHAALLTISELLQLLRAPHREDSVAIVRNADGKEVGRFDLFASDAKLKLAELMKLAQGAVTVSRVSR